jgi:hypothetical protein
MSYKYHKWYLEIILVNIGIIELHQEKNGTGSFSISGFEIEHRKSVVA